ncbi:MAG: hypothetical protein M3022_10530 [Actinomycetota bacterium]|nr:hypothetical protein [Actinomycetota bacterium]
MAPGTVGCAGVDGGVCGAPTPAPPVPAVELPPVVVLALVVVGIGPPALPPVGAAA